MIIILNIFMTSKKIDPTSTPHRPYIDPIKTIKMRRRRRRKNNRNEEEEEEEEEEKQ